MIKLDCRNCGKSFQKTVGEYNRQTKLGRINFFCSLNCGTKFQRKNQHEQTLREYSTSPNKCIECNIDLSYERRNNKTCSHVCGAKYSHKKGFSSKYTKHGKFKIKACRVCGCDTKTVYCSKVCESVSKRTHTYDKLKNGEYIGNNNSSNSIRKALIQVRGHQCEVCKNEFWNGVPINLTLHHIDGSATNNVIDNLQLLCWNCHSHTENYGRKNKKSTRSFRYQ